MTMPDPAGDAVQGSPFDLGPSCCAAGTWAAFLVALVALGGSLYLSLGMGKKACPLCYYQRIFVMGMVGVLGMGVLTAAYQSMRLSLLVLPLSAAALGVAMFHVIQEARGKMECPAGILGVGTAPQQSLTVLAVLFLILVVDALWMRAGAAWPALAAIVLGGLLAFGAIHSTAPMPPPKPEEYNQPPNICRPVRAPG